MIWAVDCHLRRENRSYINNVTKFMREPRTNGTPGSYHMVQVSYCINSKNMAIWLHVLYKNLGVYDVGGGTWRTCRDWSCCRTRSWCTTNSCLIIASSIKSPKLWNVGPTTSRQSTASSKSNAPFMKTTKWALSLSPSLSLLYMTWLFQLAHRTFELSWMNWTGSHFALNWCAQLLHWKKIVRLFNPHTSILFL